MTSRWRSPALAGCILALLALPLPAVPAGDDATEAIEAFETEYKAARDAMRARLDEVRETEEYRTAYEARDFDKVRALMNAISDPVMDEWRAKAETFAGRFPEGDAEVAVAAMRLRLALVEEPIAMFESLVEKHRASAALAPLLEAGRRFHRRMGAEKFNALMTRVIDENTTDEVLAWAHFCRGSAFLAQRDDESAREYGLKDYDRCVELADPKSSLSMRARGPRFAEEKLQIGMKAPDIEGVDLFGESFKLSDYAGKVVMLDFWGDW